MKTKKRRNYGKIASATTYSTGILFRGPHENNVFAEMRDGIPVVHRCSKKEIRKMDRELLKKNILFMIICTVIAVIPTMVIPNVALWFIYSGGWLTVIGFTRLIFQKKKIKRLHAAEHMITNWTEKYPGVKIESIDQIDTSIVANTCGINSGLFICMSHLVYGFSMLIELNFDFNHFIILLVTIGTILLLAFLIFNVGVFNFVQEKFALEKPEEEELRIAIKGLNFWIDLNCNDPE